MVIYLIGPSGVGKSHCAQHASTMLPGVIHHSLDALCEGRQFDWPTCEAALNEIERATSDQLVIVDIGAGTQTRSELRAYLAARRQQTVLLIAPPTEVHPRNPYHGAQRDLTEYIATEYTSRQDLYNNAGHTVYLTGTKPEQAAQRFIMLLKNLRVY